ncbi:hypothetical protein K469DRAFT_753369 [Zopfia rhizophila CBS 207.26]|uniref:Uncharacterized protein n=1 Tax=Zopfia rhizophila CBS 207.26 TaxID=1314779 RepID=A0A6A6DR03_9PEZI|nr:hypothetical protein K469DRAFT_753369 [Zopfia rhizophila CBS 207.26]
MYDSFSALTRRDGFTGYTTKDNDLWTLAAAQLNDKDRRSIHFSRSDKLKGLADLHELTESRRVRFVWQIAVNDYNKFAVVVEGLAWMAELICRRAVLESLYFRQTFKMWKS